MFVGQWALADGVPEQVVDVAALGVEVGEFGGEDGQGGVVGQVGCGLDDSG